MRLEDCFQAVVALTAFVTDGRMAVTVADLHRFFVTTKFKQENRALVPLVRGLERNGPLSEARVVGYRYAFSVLLPSHAHAPLQRPFAATTVLNVSPRPPIPAPLSAFMKPPKHEPYDFTALVLNGTRLLNFIVDAGMLATWMGFCDKRRE